MNIALYFGSFNPIHKGHTALAQYILQHYNAHECTNPMETIDEVWLVVSPNNPLKKADELASEMLRLKIAEDATKDMKNIRVSDLEFSLPKPNYTINSLREFQRQYPQHSFTLVIGSDNMARFNRWRDYQTILDNYSILVYPREGDDIEKLKVLYPQMRVIEGAPLFPISSTEIRNAIAQGNHNLDKWLHNPDSIFLRFYLHSSEKNSTFATDN